MDSGVRTLELPFAQGGSIAVEVTGAEPVDRGLGDAIESVTQTFDDALDGLYKIADSLHRTLQRAATPPDAATVKFGLNFSAESGVVIARVSTAASLEIVMEWKRPAAHPPV